ncbi:uncharacterized protein MONOS_15501 [Monocercomonoides exilis]|uniref:uncharacterized protein n=1 Tax=Monocercomonoides exilis TaxID=2049356 RepID=UPI00355ACB21|nr:hypothetical protein MONOS_15501 [Monocercomonoides exilis]|eukprot:MONOS_15501.1-p1 / transcript=MONOS_15501.1 / gene=MONOS_15501 / organism=Monocercomonoides_exilis_PA203 / gene_product=unspecified product / transcript_product=unspecified product / location=Mono_scaffold01252:9150-10028(-) / protein_length=218 / sequence_SO=supercontig / SO=protein_coding / is_pseudo=false
MRAVELFDIHLKYFPLLQLRIPLRFSTSYGFLALATLTVQNEVNRLRRRNENAIAKELSGALQQSARFTTPPGSEERGEQVQMEETKKLHSQHITASSTISTPPFSLLLHTQLSASSVLVGAPLKLLAPSSPATYSSSLTQKSLNISSPSTAFFSNMSSSSPSSSSPSSISSFSLPPLVTVPIPLVILGKSRLDNVEVFASSSVSATRDVFKPQSIF